MDNSPKTLGCNPFAPAGLEKNIQHLTFIINSQPEIQLLSADLQIHFDDVPCRIYVGSDTP